MDILIDIVFHFISFGAGVVFAVILLHRLVRGLDEKADEVREHLKSIKEQTEWSRLYKRDTQKLYDRMHDEKFPSNT